MLIFQALSSYSVLVKNVPQMHQNEQAPLELVRAEDAMRVMVAPGGDALEVGCKLGENGGVGSH